MSVSGVGKSAIELILDKNGVVLLATNCIAVGVNAVAVTTLMPFANTSAVVPFHFIATFVVSVVVVCKVEPIVPMYF